MSRLLVLGGSGFIGTRLVARLLEAGHEVTIGDKAESRAYPALWIRCDVREPGSLAPLFPGHDAVFNLAAEHRDDVTPKSLYDDVNVGGARNVCEAAAAAGIDRMVFTSSVAVYGFSAEELREDSPRRPFNDYGRTKLEAEAVYEAWRLGAAGRSLLIVRPTVVFGEGNRGNVYNLMRQIASGRFVMVGSGRNRKSIAYVENVAAFLDWGLGLGPGSHLYNYSDKPDFDMNGLVATVRDTLAPSARRGVARIPRFVGLAIGYAFDAAARISKRTFPISAVRVRKFTENTRIGVDRLSATDFRPPVPLVSALRATLESEFGDGPGAA